MTRKIGTLHSVQVGSSQQYRFVDEKSPDSKNWQTSFFRNPSPDRRFLYTTHLEGNEQADKKNHGGPNQTVLLYGLSNYSLWQSELALPEIGPGGFGENFTIDGMTEADACIGDIYQVGGARIQVTGPRYPCFKISRRWDVPTLTARVAETGRTGWYCRVLDEGWIEPRQEILLEDRPHPDVSVAIVNDFGHSRNRDVEAAKKVAECALLEDWWQRLVVVRAMGKER